MRKPQARRRWGEPSAGMAPGAAPRCRPALPPRSPFSPPLPELLAAEQGHAGLELPSHSPCFPPWLNLSVTPLPAPRKVQPLDRSVLAAGFGRKVGDAEERGEGRGGGRRVYGGI